jgi:hypothetical protein
MWDEDGREKESGWKRYRGKMTRNEYRVRVGWVRIKKKDKPRQRNEDGKREKIHFNRKVAKPRQ